MGGTAPRRDNTCPGRSWPRSRSWSANRRDPLTIAEIAREVGVSDDHLIRIFREAFGLPAGTYYTRLRLTVACRLLRETDEKMDDVAHHVGYSGAANLSRAFKEVMGVRPGEFRRG